ncbi:MAG TPA: hypothetical protein VN462_00230 [Negativicutes bacterium]|nr:hypothetical protein [Negativicutes bacterium]
MAFTGDDVKALAESFIDDSLIDTDVIENINLALLEFASSFRITGNQEVTVGDVEAWYPRTGGHLAINGVTCNGKEYMGKFELSYDRGMIRFPAAGVYVITSVAAPSPVASMEDLIGVNDVFKPGIAEYVGACFKAKDNDQNPDALRMESKAMAMISAASRLIGQGDRRQGQRVPFRR